MLHQRMRPVVLLAQQAEGNYGGEHPKVAAVREASRERLAKQEAEESHAKEGLVKNAATYLETFYQVRLRCQYCIMAGQTCSLLSTDLHGSA